jgi:hypothetical protein
MMIRAWEEKVRRALIAQNRTKEADVARRRMNVIDRMQLMNRYRLTEFLTRKTTARQQAMWELQRQQLHRISRVQSGMLGGRRW